MAYYSIYPEKDTTIYSHPNRTKTNTGKDEIIEIVKEKGTSDVRYYPSRILIKFKNEEINVIPDGEFLPDMNIDGEWDDLDDLNPIDF